MCLSLSKCITLTNDLIAGTELESTIINWKKKRMEYSQGFPVLGKQYWAPPDIFRDVSSSRYDRHFTVLGFTALDGSPVLCMVIIAGVQQKYEVETGLDIKAKIVGDPTDKYFFQKNRGKGKMFPMGPECITARGKTTPCLVRWSPCESITSQTL